MKKRHTTVAELTEEMVPLDSEMSIVEARDGQPPSLRNVVLMGPESRSRAGEIRRRYSNEVIEALVGMFDGVRVYANHPEPHKLDKERPVGDLIGFVSNPRKGTDRKIRGDISLIEGLEDTTRVLWCAKNRPALVGFSPHLRGAQKTWKRGGPETIVGVGSVASADIVTEGATTFGLFESTETEEGESMDWKTATLSELRDERPDLVESIQAEGSTAAENALLKAQVKDLEAAAEKTKADSRATLVESLVDKLPAATQETVRKVSGAMSDDDLTAYVGTLTESISGEKKKPESSEKRRQESAEDSDKGASESQIQEAMSFG